MNKEDFKNFFENIDQVLGNLTQDGVEQSEAGYVRSVKDGVIEIEGISSLKMGEVVTAGESGVESLVVQIGQDQSYAVALAPSEDIKSGDPVQSTGKTLSFPASEALLGRVVDPLANVLDGGNPLPAGTPMPLETIAPDVMSRQPVTTPVQTGILAIDALIPIGRGQRELIIGDRQTGKSTIAIDTILNQKGQNMICVYVAIAQRDAKTAQVVRTLQEHGAMKYTTVVSASASGSAMSQFLAPYAGTALAEYFMNQGKDVLVVFDDLSKHAVAYREVSLLLNKPPGREAYPGDVFYIHSRLLERAARLDKEHGGGSITALPIIETQAGDVSAYIPTNVISITDGQIFLEPSLFYRGIRPAVNIGISVSRVGSAAQTNIMKKISGRAKLDLAQYYDLAAFSQFASELDEESKQKLVRGERLEESLKQRPAKPRALWQEAFILWSAMHGYLDHITKEEVSSRVENGLVSFESSYPDLAKKIEKEKALTEDVQKSLDEAAKKIFR